MRKMHQKAKQKREKTIQHQSRTAVNNVYEVYETKVHNHHTSLRSSSKVV